MTATSSEPDQPRLAGVNALVVGAAGGIGGAVATLFAAHGANVAGADLQAPPVDPSSGTPSLALDVTSAIDWEAAVEAVVRQWGSLTVLVNAAGVTGRKRLHETSEDEYRRVVDVNQVGTFLGMKAVAEPMRAAGGGSIVNLSSVAGIRGASNAFSYAASKWAVRGMTQAAAIDLGSLGIRVNSVVPGPTRTQMMAGLEDDSLNLDPPIDLRC